MTTASLGLGKALARAGAAGTVVAIAEMSASDILAAMSEEQRAELSASLSPPSPADSAANSASGDNETDSDPDDGKCGKCMEPMKDGKCAKCEEASADSAASAHGNASAADPRIKSVATAVAADGPCKGKADVALAILADDSFAGLSADAVIKMVGMSGVTMNASDPESEERGAMLTALKGMGNANTGNAGGGQVQQVANHGWNDIHAEIRERRGR